LNGRRIKTAFPIKCTALLSYAKCESEVSGVGKKKILGSEQPLKNPRENTLVSPSHSAFRDLPESGAWQNIAAKGVNALIAGFHSRIIGDLPAPRPSLSVQNLAPRLILFLCFFLNTSRSGAFGKVEDSKRPGLCLEHF
jgi:hypothetical protein